jgi:membrane-associated phospholipid phosphatase
MSDLSGAAPTGSYFSQVSALLRLSVVRLVRSPQAPLRAVAARRLGQQALMLTAFGAVLIVALMLTFDAFEIGLMPPRGTPSLWPVRILTDLGKDEFVLWPLAAALLVIGLVVPLLQGPPRKRLQRFGADVQYLFFAVLVPVLVAQVIKWVVGRGRPFVGGKADPLNFAPFNGTEAYFSLPSGHAVTACALAFAAAAVWPRTRIVMVVYALAIMASRLVLLAHHPSDVVAGGLLGVIGAMAMRYWFAARQTGFAIEDHGKIVSR